MIHEVHLREEFGTHLSDGAKAYDFRVKNVDAYLKLSTDDKVLFDFTGVRCANSSFINALINELPEEYGEAVLERLIFKGCLPPIQVLIQAAVDLGLMKHAQRVHA